MQFGNSTTVRPRSPVLPESDCPVLSGCSRPLGFPFFNVRRCLPKWPPNRIPREEDSLLLELESSSKPKHFLHLRDPS